MNDVFSLWLGLSPELSIRWGLTLLHFVWQGAVVGVLAGIAAKLLRHQAAFVRYWLHSVALMACPLCVAMTFALVEVPDDFQVSALPESTAIPESPGLIANGHLALLDVPYPMLPEVAPEAIITQNSNEAAGIIDATASIEPAFDWLPVVAQWMTILYAAGVFCFLIRLGIALRGGQRLRAISRPMSDSVLLGLVRDQAKRIGLRIVPVVAYCERVAVPTVIGVLRPMILLPATLTTGLSPDEFASILSHELAHIRRYDLWMNLLQRLIESVLFFHPVVWILSRRLSAEREISCDDLVVRSGHEPINYAGALLRMAELCSRARRTGMGPEPGLLSADGGDASQLEHRILRLVRNGDNLSLGLTRMSFAVAAAAVVLCGASFFAVAQNGGWNSKADGDAKADQSKNQGDQGEAELGQRDPQGRVNTTEPNQDASPKSDENGIYWFDRGHEGWMTGMKVLHWPSAEDPIMRTQYLLRNDAEEIREIDIQYSSGDQTFSIDHRKHLDAELGGGTSWRHLFSVGPHETLEDQRFQRQIDLTGLADGQYAIEFSSMFFVPVEGQIGARTGLPFKLTLPLTIPKVQSDAEPASDLKDESGAESDSSKLPIQWGEPVAGLRIGAMFVDRPDEEIRLFNTTDAASIQLYVQNISRQKIVCQILLPHPMDGWGLNIENQDGVNIRPNQIYMSSFSPQRVLTADVLPGEMQSITGKPDKFRERTEDTRDAPSVDHANFLIAPKSSERGEYRPPFSYGLPAGLYTARVFASLRRSDITKATLNAETAILTFRVGDESQAASDPKEGKAIATGQGPPSNAARQIRYPHCIVNTEDLQPRPLPEVIADFNRTSLENPWGILQPPISGPETRDAIAKFAAEVHVPESVRVQLHEILKTDTLPSNAYFRRFTRLDDEQQMRGVWWVRLVVETPDGPVYSVPVRTTPLFARPYTQMERQQNAAEVLTLINRVVSYYKTPPEPIESESTALPQASVDALIRRTQEALKRKDIAACRALFETTGASESLQEFAVSELLQIAQSQVEAMKVSPMKLRGDLLTWSAWQFYKPNLPIVGFLEIEYTPAGSTFEVPSTLSLELGFVGDELRLVSYFADGEAKSPERIKPVSISGHTEPLADGTHLVTDVVINPGTLLSAHLANEEVRLRDFSKYKPDTIAATDPDNLPLSEPADPSKPEVPPGQGKRSLDDEQRREFLLKTVSEADRIPDEQARQKAQWDLVHPLVQMGLLDDAFRQAMKLKTLNPQTCIYSLTTLAEDAMKRGDQATVQNAWDAARKANTESGTKHNHYVIQMGFKLNRPLAEILATASTARKADEQRAYLDIRNELTWRGRLDEAYEVTAAHLSKIPKEINDREMAYYCSHAKSFDYYAKHDHYGQAIRIIEQMPRGKNRDAAIGQLIDGLLVVANKDTVPQERLAIADNWVGQIEDRISQAAMKARILAHRLPSMSVEELEQRIAQISSREEKSEYLRWIFRKLLEENRFEEADRILSRQILAIKEQPREEVKSKFGNVNDDDAVRMMTWTHHRDLVLALHRAGRIDEARARLEAMKDLPDSEPKFLIGNLAGIRLQLYMELGDFDSVEKFATEKPNPVGTIGMAAWMMKKGQFDRGWKHVAPLVDASSESFFPTEASTQSLYFAAQPFEDLATELFKVNRPDDALTFMNKLPESRDTALAFETFGDLLVTSGRLGELDQWLARMPHETARTHTRLGALRTITKPPEAATQP